VVTLLTVPLLELELELVDWVLELEAEPVFADPLSTPELVLVAGVELDAAVLADERLASAGSCPDTSTIVISRNEATNSATAPLMMRRRIRLARLSRALLRAAPRARAS
jgi:hypothetical protein